MSAPSLPSTVPLGGEFILHKAFMIHNPNNPQSPISSQSLVKESTNYMKLPYCKHFWHLVTITDTCRAYSMPKGPCYVLEDKEKACRSV